MLPAGVRTVGYQRALFSFKVAGSHRYGRSGRSEGRALEEKVYAEL
jgi:hypothetical protein